MSNILYKQNLEENLRLLAAQRQSYNEAKLYRSGYRILVFVPFLISFLVLNSYIDATDQYSVLRFLIDLFVLVMGGFLMKKSSQYQIEYHTQNLPLVSLENQPLFKEWLSQQKNKFFSLSRHLFQMYTSYE